MKAYDAAEWSDLFVAAAGATAALAGLLFVAVSINIERILKFEGLPERALQTLLLLLGALVASIFALIPSQGATALGIELVVASSIVLVAVAVLGRRSRWSEGPRPQQLARLVIAALGTVPFVVGGASLLLGVGGGLAWIAAGVIGAIVGAVLNAWVLLVEILR